MPTYRLTIEYDGARFSGWQSQPGQRTVQGALEEAMSVVLREPVRIQGAGRTDAGVHAMGQVASFSTDVEFHPSRLMRGVSALAGRDVAVHRVEEVAAEFNARFDARGKHYRYTVQTGSVPSPLTRSRAWFVPRLNDMAPVSQAAALLVGEHDFAGFRAADCERENTVREITALTVSPLEHGVVVFDVHGTAFLKNMVRIIAGTLVGVGTGQLSVERVGEALSSGDRRLAGMTAPAHGLCLMKVFYDS